MSNRKKIIIILVLVIVLIVASLAFYFFYFNKKEVIEIKPPEGESFDFNVGNRNINNAVSNSKTETDFLTRGETIVSGEGKIPALRKITANPVAGVVSKNIIDAEKKEKTLIRYIERITGNIYELFSDSWTINRISNKTIPKIYDAVWAKDANSAYLRYVKDESDEVSTYFIELKPVKQTALASTTINSEEENTTNDDVELEGSFLQSDLRQLIISSDGKNILYHKSINGSGSIMEAEPQGYKEREIFKSPLSEFLISWPKNDTIFLTTKAASNIPGYLYLLKIPSQKLEKVLGDINGLTSLESHDAKNTLYSESGEISFSLNLLDLANKNSTTLLTQTLPEKCVWSRKEPLIVYCAVPSSIPEASYPESWYKGLVSFTDNIRKINVKTMEDELLVNLEQTSGEKIDGISLSLSPKEDYLFFIDKKDSSLWSLKLAEEIATSTPEE